MKKGDFPERKKLLKELFEQLDPELMGEKYKSALAKGSEAELIRETAAFFRRRSPRPYCKAIDLSACTMETADRAADGDVTVVGIPQRFADGKIDWFFNPTFAAPPVNHEWLWQLNRMYFWRDLVFAWQKTHSEKYAAAFNEQLFSWVSTAGVPGEQWNVPNSVWRTIETGLRMMYSWPLCFENFRKTPVFTDENICLMLGSMYRQALHLQAHHKERTNWLLM